MGLHAAAKLGQLGNSGLERLKVPAKDKQGAIAGYSGVIDHLVPEYQKHHSEALTIAKY